MSAASGLRVLVGVKRVVDYAVKVRVNSAKSGIELGGVKMSLNPFDEIATEEAVKLRDAGVATEVIACTIGPKQAVDQLRTALAMGADKGVHIDTGDVRIDQDLQPLAVSRLLSFVAKKYNVDVVLLGKQAIDDDAGQTGQLLSAELGWGSGTFCSKISLEKGAEKAKEATVTREVDGGLQTIRVPLPAVFTTDLRLNTPRYATLPNIMKAKKKPVETLALKDTGVDIAPRLKTIKVTEPGARKAGVTVASVEELVDKLKNEAKLI
jgi:electron transfer flavoprotein beta subunit